MGIGLGMGMRDFQAFDATRTLRVDDDDAIDACRFEYQGSYVWFCVCMSG